MTPENYLETWEIHWMCHDTLQAPANGQAMHFAIYSGFVTRTMDE